MDTREVFKLLGFTEGMEVGCPAYVYDFGNLRLSAVEGINKHYNTVFHLGGVASGTRSIRLIQTELPLVVESFEQGVALIAHIVGSDFKPVRPTPWLSDGRDWQCFLPWVRERQLREQLYASRPKCSVARDWFRTARPKLYAMAKEAAEDDIVRFAFNGEALRFTARHAAVVVPALGDAWPDCYAIKAVELEAIPKRIRTDPVQIIVEEDTLAIDRRIWRLVGQFGTKVAMD